MKTETLIQVLAADASRPVVRIRPLMGAALAAGAAGSLALFMLSLTPRVDLAAALLEFNFRMKIAFTLCVALTAAVSLDAVARPLPRAPGLRRLALAPLVLLTAVVVELVTAPASSWFTLMVGRNAPRCLALIPLFSALPAFFLMVALRRGAPARPALAGAIAGLTAGGLGASLYATFCPVDNPLFVATWYSLAIGAVTALCALSGRRWLRW